MSDSSYPYHIQVGYLMRRQQRRLWHLLAQRNGRWTIRVSKWAQGSHFQTGYRVSRGSIAGLLDAAFREFALTPPLQEFHISF